MAQKTKENDWHNLNHNEVLHILKSSHDGLSSEEAEKRLKKHGRNKLPEAEKSTLVTIAINQFKNPLVYILLAAATISFALREFIDFWVILAAVFLNTAVGFIQELKAENTLRSLKAIVEHTMHIIRESLEREVEAELIVPGDIMAFRAGDKIAADGRLLEAHDLEVDESSLTGESIPVGKVSEVLDQKGVSQSKENMVYMGTSIVKGRGLAVVTGTGLDTKFGQIAQLIRETEEEKTPLQAELSKFSKSFGVFTFFMIVLIMAIGLSKGIPFLEIFTTSVAIAVAAIPEGLLVAVTAVLAIGMQRILKNGSLVRKLIAAETLGNTTVICTDKTGTLTRGEMQVDQIITLSSVFSLKEKVLNQIVGEEMSKLDHMVALKIGMICNNAIVENPDDGADAWRIHGDYTEKALLRAGIGAGFDPKNTKLEFERINEIPFTSERKFMATLNKTGSKECAVYVKGAPEEVINRSRYVFVENKKKYLTEEEMKLLRRKQNDLSREGLRVIAVAFKTIDETAEGGFSENNDDEIVNELVFVGLIALKDHLRPEAKNTLKLAQEAGIRTVIITGDNRLTAKAIATELGMKIEDDNILEGELLDRMNTMEFADIVSKIKIYARVSPHHKSRIVDAWQSRNQVVAMTGDGVNDAPALKSADIGIALGSGTEVAKETADIVLLDDNFKTIITAVKEGRIIFDNIRKVTLYLISDSFAEVVIVGGGLLAGFPLPLIATQILWINMVTDSLPNAALTMEPEEDEVMKELPRKKNEPLVNGEMKVLTFVISVVMGLTILALFAYVWRSSGSLEEARTVAFTALATSSLICVFSIRSLHRSVLNRNIFSNKYLVAAVVAGLVLQILAIYNEFLQSILGTVSLGYDQWIIIMAAVAFRMILIELVKFAYSVNRNKKRS